MLGFTDEQVYRYSRHIILPDVGGKGQKKLLQAKVLLVGAGGLGSPTAMYLAAAGVGTLGIVEFDNVDLSNLQRQLLHRTKDVGRPKLDSAQDTINALNPDVKVVKHPVVLDSTNVMDIIKDYDIIVNGTDNFPTRYLVNDACVFAGKPLVDGSIFMFEGQATVYDAKHGPCYRCLFPTPPPPGEVPSCQEAGVLGVLPGIIGSIEAIETIKLILGKGEPLIGRLLLFDALAMEFREMKVEKDPNCPVCSEHPTITELIDYEQFCGVPFPENPAKQEEELEAVPA
ncbi:MAG TPA: molybdopterin-synthase adenylyltransferase MoeB [Anaerolineae bacterium]|nr:molybdopterin-synthase adenylyltransferase MoeB [Anaerolineae bacterium]